MHHAQVCNAHRAPAKGSPVRPVELTEDELERLLGAFIEGKTEILEDDAVLLVQWAQHMRMGAMILQLVLDGELTPTVEHGEVKIALRASQAAARRN
jgi:hypothetical protein